MTDRLNETARRVCTPRQLDVLAYHLAGYSHRRIGRILQISPAAVRDHLEAAHRRIRKAEQEDA